MFWLDYSPPNLPVATPVPRWLNTKDARRRSREYFKASAPELFTHSVTTIRAHLHVMYHMFFGDMYELPGDSELVQSMYHARNAGVSDELRTKIRFVPNQRFYDVVNLEPVSFTTISDLIAVEGQCLSCALQILNGVQPELFFKLMAMWVAVMCKLGAYASAYDVVTRLNAYGILLRDHPVNTSVKHVLNAQKDSLKAAANARSVLGNNTKHVFSDQFLETECVHHMSKKEITFTQRQAAARPTIFRPKRQRRGDVQRRKESTPCSFNGSFFKQSPHTSPTLFRTPLTVCVGAQWSDCECGAFTCPAWKRKARQYRSANTFETCVSGGQHDCTCGAYNCTVWSR